MVDLLVYDLFLCALIIAKGVRSYRYGVDTSLMATVIRHGTPGNRTTPNLLTPSQGTQSCTTLQSERQRPQH